jgi:folate-binding protein YgfZ
MLSPRRCADGLGADVAQSQARRLSDRGIVALSGPDALTWLDNLVTADLTRLDRAPVVFSALLSPQGKMLFEFFVWKARDSLLLDVWLAQSEGLVKRLRLYKLRAQVDFRDATADWAVGWAEGSGQAKDLDSTTAPDPRSDGSLWRGLYPRTVALSAVDAQAYAAARVRLNLPEAPDDYTLGDVFLHEANMDLAGGVSFTKGCFIGQEVVSRMQNKTVVRKRVVRIASDEPLACGNEIKIGEAVIGRVGTVANRDGLALLRLDRVVEALDKGDLLTVGAGHALRVDATAIDRYRQSVKTRPVIDL